MTGIGPRAADPRWSITVRHPHSVPASHSLGRGGGCGEGEGAAKRKRVGVGKVGKGEVSGRVRRWRKDKVNGFKKGRR